jgi:hypothetical protein
MIVLIAPSLYAPWKFVLHRGFGAKQLSMKAIYCYINGSFKLKGRGEILCVQGVVVEL